MVSPATVPLEKGFGLFSCLCVLLHATKCCHWWETDSQPSDLQCVLTPTVAAVGVQKSKSKVLLEAVIPAQLSLVQAGCLSLSVIQEDQQSVYFKPQNTHPLVLKRTHCYLQNSWPEFKGKKMQALMHRVFYLQRCTSVSVVCCSKVSYSSTVIELKKQKC